MALPRNLKYVRWLVSGITKLVTDLAPQPRASRPPFAYAKPTWNRM